jgi:TonB family protein
MFFAAAVATSSPASGPPPAAPSVVTNPDWAAVPSVDDMVQAFPTRAMDEGVEGRVTLRCTVDQLGSLHDCRVEGETPAGYGFGEAALGLSDGFRMKPRLEDGRPVPGAEVRIPIVFKIPQGFAPPPLDLALRCYGLEAADAEAGTGDADAMKRAVMLTIMVGIQAVEKKLKPSQLESMLTQARLAASTPEALAKAGETRSECQTIYGGFGRR